VNSSALPERGPRTINAEGVRKFQPRVELWQPWDKEVPVSNQTLKGFANAANPFRVPSVITHLIPGLPKLNPGLELANTFGVKILSGKQEVVGLLHRECFTSTPRPTAG